MIKIGKINISIIEKNEELGDSNLKFKIYGDNIDYVIVNTLRRTIFENIPIYAFNIFNFEKNTSIFHNNYLKLRLQHMPVWSIKNNVDFIDYNKVNDNMGKIDENDDEDNVGEIESNDNLNSSSLNQLTMYVNYKNKSNEIFNVTTAHAKFYYDQKQIANPYKNDCLIVKLHPNEEIALSAITSIGTEEKDTKYCPVNVVTYKQINDNEFDFYFESTGQITEKQILLVALINIERKLRNFLKVFLEDINKEIDPSEEEGLIIVNNEDHTMGNLISRGMQKHSKIKFAGYNLPHPLANKVHFHYQLDKGGDIKKIMGDVVEYYSELFDNIKKSVNKF
jgi:DNA-directed RNA polymerase subunit L